MRIIETGLETPPVLDRTAVTIGVFDGVHLGHRRVIGELIDTARRSDLLATAVTFDPHPAVVLGRRASRWRLASIDDRLERFEALGVDAAVVLRFDDELAAVDPNVFVERLLVNGLGARSVVVGNDFRFGCGRAGDVQTLRSLGITHGFDVAAIEDVPARTVPRVSSTVIRAALRDGMFETVERLLGHAYEVRVRLRRHTVPDHAALHAPDDTLAPPPGGYGVVVSASGAQLSGVARVASEGPWLLRSRDAIPFGDDTSVIVRFASRRTSGTILASVR